MKASSVAIVGAAETTELGRIPGLSQIQLHADDRCAIFNNEDVELGPDVTYEDLLERKEQLLDMSAATEGWSWRRRVANKNKA